MNQEIGVNPESRTAGKTNRFGLGLVLALMIAATLAMFMSSGGDLLEGGTPAPAFDLESVNGTGRISLESLRGRVVLIDFWSTSCPPCLRQMRDLEILHRHMDEEDVVIVGINAEGASPSALREFTRSQRVGYTMLADSGQVSERYRVQRLPTLYIIDQEGMVRWTREGYVPHQELTRVIQEFL